VIKIYDICMAVTVVCVALAVTGLVGLVRIIIQDSRR
jgi:hypothetical protein